MKIALGTVQFGLQYGINNSSGIPSDDAIRSIFKEASDSGIDILDTAAAYGNAEQRIAELSNFRFKVISKFPNVNDSDSLRSELDASLSRLKCSSIYGYLAHNADTLIAKTFLWTDLQEKKAKGIIQKIGYSLYEPDQLQKLLDLNCVPDLVQLPYSLLDRKFESYLQILNDLKVEVHIRSVYLQGLYHMDLDKIPDQLSPLKPFLGELHAIAADGNITIGELALNYAYNNPYINRIVLGVDSLEQLQENILFVKKWKGDSLILQRVNQIDVNCKELLNPSNWKR